MSRLAILVIDQVADQLRRSNNEAGADRLLVAKEEILARVEGGSSPSTFLKLPEGSTPVSSSQWERIGKLVPSEVYESSDAATDLIAADWLTSAVDDAVRFDRLRAYVVAAGLIKNPDEHGLFAVYERLVAERDALTAERDGLQEAEVNACQEIERLSGELGEARRRRQSAENLLTQLRLGLSEALRSEDTTFDGLVLAASLLRREAAKAESKPAELKLEPTQPTPQVSETANGGGKPVVSSPEQPPVVLIDRPPVPDHYPGRQGPVNHVPMADLAKGLTVTDGGAMVPKAEPPSLPNGLTLDQRMECIARIAEDEPKADIAARLGLPSGRYIQPVAIANKIDIDRVRQAAPQDREGVLVGIRKRLEGKVA